MKYKNLYIKIVEIIVITIVSILSVYIMAIVLDSIYNREGIIEQIIKEKQELGY